MSVKYAKDTTVGIDTKIQALQNFLYNKLRHVDFWGDSIVYNSYGRAYKNKKKDTKLPEVDTDGTEYEEVYPNDNVDAQSFFTVESDAPDQAQDGFMNIAEVDLVFFVNLGVIKSESHRADQEAHRDVTNLLLLEPYGFRFNGIITGVENVLPNYPDEKHDDLSPYHIFKLKLINNYEQTSC